MAIENKIPQEDQLFDDTFALDAPLSEIYLDVLRRAPFHDEPIPEPWPVYAADEKVYAPEYGISIKPDTFHQAADFGDTPQDMIETANAHYQQLRQIGMKVVGHTFEAIEKDTDDFQTHGQYPTILVGAKYLSRSRQNDQPVKYGDDAGGPFSDVMIDALGLTGDKLEEILINPIRQYLEWCKETNQPYVLTNLSALFSYVYQARQQTLGLQEVTSRMGRVHFDGNWAPVGNLWSATRSFEHFVKDVTGKEVELPV